MPEQPIILFDGVCNLCNASVQFVIRRDAAARFRFAPIQSVPGRELMASHGLDPDSMNSLVLVEGGHSYVRSDAALRIARGLPRPWRWLWVFRILPRAVRDFVYAVIARHRYRWFGRRAACMVPTGEQQERFLA